MSLSTERTMRHMEETIDRLNASMDAKVSASATPILACLAELEMRLAGPPLNTLKHIPKSFANVVSSHTTKNAPIA
ncbi:hypothetical protein VP01_1574g2, partial [Puccinia sorghi]